MDKQNRFWLYLGIILICSGIGVGVGATILALYFWSDIKQTIAEPKEKNTAVHFWDYLDKKSPKYYDDDTVNGMR